MTGSDVSFAKKRLARDLKILVVAQVIALCSSGLGLFLFASDIVPDYPDWDNIHLLCGTLFMCGIVVFCATAGWGCLKLTRMTSLPISIRFYAWGFWGIILAFVFFTLVPIVNKTSPYSDIPPFILPFYCIIPQFFIACWLTKETKDATM